MTEYKLENLHWSLKVYQDDETNEFKYLLQSKKNQEVYADEDYHYRIITSSKRGSRFAYLMNESSEYKAKKLIKRKIYSETKEVLVVEGKFEGTEIYITQKFILNEGSKWLDEYITFINKGQKRVKLDYINLDEKKYCNCYP